MRKTWLTFVAFFLLFSSALWARPVESPRGLCTFEVPGNLEQTGGTRWGKQPGLTIEMREEYAPKGELKDLILLMSPPSANGKKIADDSVDLEGASGQVIARKDGTTYTKALFVRKGEYNLGWLVTSMSAQQDEIDFLFDELRRSVRFQESQGASQLSKSFRDPSGALEISLPGDYAAAGRNKMSNGEVMVLLTPLKEGGDTVVKDFTYKYEPKGFKSYLRRADVEMGEHRGGMILCTSEDEALENQMVLLTNGKTSVVMSFMGPARLRARISLLRERVAGAARWTR